MKALFLLCLPLAAQTAQPPTSDPLPSTAVFALVGYGTKIDGTFGYAATVSQSAGVMSASYFRYIPVHGKLIGSSFPALTTGAALHLRDFGIGHWEARMFALAQAGAVTTANAALFTQSYGGFVTVGRKGSRWRWLLGVDEMKTASGAAYANFDVGVVVIP